MPYRIYSIHSLKKCNVFNRAKKNSPGSVDLYAKCIKEGPVEWTKPERALEAAKNVWTKSKLRLVSTSVTLCYTHRYTIQNAALQRPKGFFTRKVLTYLLGKRANL